MAGPLNLSFGTSVVKRESKDIEAVEDRLLSKGWEKTDEVAGGRIRYFENAGINLTVINGPLGVTIMPSGPVRGLIFGDNAVSIGTGSAIGAGEPGPTRERSSSVRTEGRADDLT